MSKLQNRKAVAPVIATLLLVAIAVVGGTLVFVFSQGFFSQAQISSIPTIDALSFEGYDATDAQNRQIHSGLLTDNQATPSITDGTPDSSMTQSERVAIYLTNNGASEVTIDEFRFGGQVYSYQQGGTIEDYAANTNHDDGEYVIITRSDATAFADLMQSVEPTLALGQTVTILLELEQDIKMERDVQANIQTSNGASFLNTVKIGQQRG